MFAPTSEFVAEAGDHVNVEILMVYNISAKLYSLPGGATHLEHCNMDHQGERQVLNLMVHITTGFAASVHTS